MNIKSNHQLILLILILTSVVTVPAQQIRVACVGNSITAGAWLSNPAEDSYPGILGGLLGPDYHVRNFGYSGSTVLKNGNSPYWEKPSYQFALGFFPDIVIILLGTNDSKPENWLYKDEFEADYTALIQSFINKNADVKFILCYPPPILSDPDIDANLRNEVIQKISTVAKQTGSKAVNLYGSFENRDDLYLDEIHPNREGYQVIANLVYKKIIALSDVTAPDIPKNFLAEGADRSVALSWNPNSEPDLGSYVLYRGETENDVLHYLTNVQWPQVHYVDYNVVNGDSYYFNIAAMDLTGNTSGRSAVKMAVPRDNSIPSPPRNLTAFIEFGKVLLSWEQNLETDLMKYNIYRSTEPFQSTEMAENIGRVIQPDTVYYDSVLAENTNYFFGVSAVDSSGNESGISNIVTVVVLDVSLENGMQGTTSELVLAPNPFNSEISFIYNLKSDAHVRINIFDILGRNVYSIVDEEQKHGWHKETWNGENNFGKPVSAGIYLYSVNFAQEAVLGKIIHLK
jgi:lysophospholipase L1-like esterase